MASISHIPITKGCEIPIIKQFNNDGGYHFTDGLGDCEELKSLQYEDIKISGSLSPLRIIELVKKYPNEINLLCLAPLTNIAAAYMLYPDIINKVKFVYIMGGTTKCFGNHISTAEYNSAYDFISSKIVLENFKNIILTPWEPTSGVLYSMEYLKEIKKDFEEQGIVYNTRLFSYWELVLKNYDLRNNGIGMEICDLYSIIPAFNSDSVKKFFACDIDVIIDSSDNVGMTTLRNKVKYQGSFKDFINLKYEHFNGNGKNLENGKEYFSNLNLPNKKIVLDQLDKDELHKEFLSIFTELLC
jgi:inosine-uridine nucleoside N-ribohydrolase